MNSDCKAFNMKSFMVFLISLSLMDISVMGDLYKILVVSPLPIKSHAILTHALVKVLLEAGNEVTYLTVTRSKMSHQNLKQIFVNIDNGPEAVMPHGTYGAKNNKERFARFITKQFSAILQQRSTYKLLLDTKQTFDLVIAEWFFNDILIGLAALYDCPFIWFASTEFHWMMPGLIEKKSVSPVQGIDSEAFADCFESLTVLRGKPLPSYEKLRSTASLVFLNSHMDLDRGVKWPRRFKPVAGYHLDQNIKPLSKNLRNIMDNAKHGVIYFSLGTSMDSLEMPDEVKQQLLEMFGGLKQTVIWKLEAGFTYLPSNVHIYKWILQQSILSHPNCVLFITQGGVLSKIESVYFGVPMIGIPLFGDQFINVDSAVAKGIAKRVDASYSMADDIKEAMLEMLSNTSYRRKVKKLSFDYRNRSTTPRDDLIYWVNSTIRPHQNKTTVFNITYLTKIPRDIIALTAAMIAIALIFKHFSLVSSHNRMTKKKNK